MTRCILISIARTRGFRQTTRGNSQPNSKESPMCSIRCRRADKRHIDALRPRLKSYRRETFVTTYRFAAVLGNECGASFFARRAADRFSEACCGKGVDPVDAATAWLIAREAAQRRSEPWKQMRPGEL